MTETRWTGVEVREVVCQEIPLLGQSSGSCTPRKSKDTEKSITRTTHLTEQVVFVRRIGNFWSESNRRNRKHCGTNWEGERGGK